MTADDRPESVEEAGALLGATITRCGLGSTKVNAPPKGMHSSFAHVSSVPSSELLARLYYLRAFLRSAPQGEPLVAAPSLLAVLMKLLSMSNQLAAKNASHAMDMNHRDEVPPMMSTPLRKLWTECVVLCHRLGENLSGSAKTSIYNFLRNMITLAGMNPRTAKAAGGTRIAALDVIGGLFDDDSLAPKLAGWCYDVLQLCLRALRSSGNGEPTYRISAMKTACSVAKACRVAHLKAKPVERPEACLLIPGAMEGPAVQESIKILRQATADKFPEVRSVAASFAGLLPPMLVLPTKTKPNRSPDAGGHQQDIAPIVNLEEVITLTLRHIDDEKAEVAAGWSEALARCICTAIEFGRQKASSDVANRDVEADQETPGPASGSDGGPQKGGRRKEGSVFLCRNLKFAIRFLVRHFVKVGGELSAARAGGSFSVGGRAVRVGVSLALMKLLRIHSSLGMISDENGISMHDTIKLILEMAGEETQKQFLASSSSQALDATLFLMAETKQAPGNALFGAKRSKADAGLVRLAVGNVLRYGISELSSETAQLNILQDLIQFSASSATTAGQTNAAVNPHQLQVILIEISHLLTTLGEAAASKVEDLVTNLKALLSHQDHGVRHEAAVACSAFTASFPEEGRKLLISSVEDLKTQHAQLMSMGGTSQGGEANDPKRSFGRMFRRPRKETEKSGDVTLNHQYAVHGIALMVSIVVRDLPRVPGGLSTDHLNSVLEVAEMLVSCQLNDVITKANPAVACTCARAGFGVITGIMATGPGAVGPHTKKIFELWQKSYKGTGKVAGLLGVDHDLSCVEAVLSSVVAFLSYCSELLLSVPDALSQIAVILEEILNMFMPDGRFGKERANPATVGRLESAKASLMEAFAWLPSGSFPMAADSVFKFAARQIKSAIAGEVTCSILPSLVNKEDMLLDAKSLTRVDRAGQVGGARDVEESIITLTSEAALHGERESVLHLPGSHAQKSEDTEFRRSEILGMFALDTDESPPTPLHAAVGTWRKPVDVSCSSAVRLLDAAIQAFSATFGLKDGMEQQEAMEMLESLIPPFLTQLASAIGMNTTLTEQATRMKPKEDNAAVANITAVLLSCLKALPLHEATHNVSISLGPPWMNKAKDLLLTLLPSSSNIVRRAAAEGLALLATLGVTEDAHFLQSAVLHSLDEVMQGNQPDGKPRTLPLEPVSASRAGSLLTLACIQRTAQKVSETKMGRTRGRALSAEEVILQAEEELPTLQMMTRVLPSVVCHGFRDFFIVQTHALHAFGLLLAYSSKLEKEHLDAEDFQLLRKGIELVEDNFVASWTAASAISDAGQEGEKLASEVSFLAVLLRLMALLVPSLRHIRSEDPSIASRFLCMATVVLESRGSHPTVAIECMAFFEILTKNQHLLPPLSTNMAHAENPLLSCTPFIVESLKPDYPDFFLLLPCRESGGCLLSARGLRAIMRAVRIMLISQIGIEQDEIQFVSKLFAFLEATCSARVFAGATLHRPLAAPRASEVTAVEGIALEKEVTEVLRILLHSAHSSSGTDNRKFLRWILFIRSLLGNAPTSSSEDEEPFGRSIEGVMKTADSVAAHDVSTVLKNADHIRWQLKSFAMQLATIALGELSLSCSQRGDNFVDSADFSHKAAEKEIQKAFASGFDSPPSRLVLHLRGILSLACTTTVASVDQAQLPTLQEGGVLFLSKLISCFQGVPDPEQPDSGILDQYATQIFSSVKHALDDLDEMSGEAYFRRFLAACEAIQTIVRIEMTKDPMVLKRITRPTVPLAEETPFFEFDGAYPNIAAKTDGANAFGNNRAALLALIGKLWTVGKLLSLHGENDAEASTVKQLVDNEINIAVHSAAVAFDGVHLLLGAGASLCGIEGTTVFEEGNFEGYKEQAAAVSGSDPGYYLFHNIQDIDDSVKAAITRAWAACGCFALRSLVKSIASESNEERKQSCSIWVEKLVPLMFAGLDDALSALSSSNDKKASNWYGGIDTSEVAVHCLYGLRIFVEESSSTDSQFEKECLEVEQVLDQLRETIILPALGQRTDTDTSDGNGPKEAEKPTAFSLLAKDRQAAVVKEACDLLRHVSAAPSTSSSSFLMSILTPLDLLQRKSIEYGKSTHLEEIISTCLTAACGLISNSKTEDSFVKSMTQVALDVHLTENTIPEKVNEAARSLLKECLSHKSIGTRDRRTIAYELAKTGHWETWSIVCAVDDGLAAADSMSVLRTALLDTSSPDKQLESLSVLRKLVQTPNSALVGRVMNEVGAEVLHFFKMFGTLAPGATLSRAGQSRRTSACADAMKIVLVAFQQFVSDSAEEEVFVSFLLVVFEYLIILLRFNGLPNHPPPQTGSDPALGRMTAQAILHVARTAPAGFKATLASMSEADRTVLEFAVRAEMTGYANTSAQAPAKKKLNLQGFKK